MNLARIILIVAAFSVAGVTALLVKNYLQSREAEFAVTNKEPKIEKVPTVRILVADSDLAAGTMVSEKLLRWQTWPNDGLSPEYIVQGKDGTSDKPADFSGWAVRRGIATGEPITRHRLLEPGTAGFLAGALSPGMRATSISVNAETGTAGFILPGDRVDVLLTQQISQTRGVEGGNRDKFISETVISNVRVLAIDQDFNDIDEQTRVGKTVTLELTPKQAESLAVAKSMGRISLSLRSFLRNADIEKKPTFTSDEDVSNFLRPRPPTPVQVLIAKHNLTAGALLRDTDFTWQKLGAGESGKDYISKTPTSATALRGSYLKVDVEGNKAIPQDGIIRPGEHGFIVAALLPGMRAISMAVSQVSGGSGFVAPGDRVDMLLTHQIDDSSDKAALTPRRYSETILKDLRLLAIEQIVDPNTGKPQVGKTVTLEVTPKQAEVVNVAASIGQLSLSLRSVPAGDDGADDDEQQIRTADDEVSRFIRDRVSSPVQVLVAKHKLSAGTLLHDTDFTWKQLSAGESGKGKISKALTSSAALRGSYLKVDVDGNKVLLRDDIIRPGEHGFIVAALLPGMRAISMAVDQVNSVSGYVAPGDRIDLLLTHAVDDTSDEPQLTPRRYSETILEDLRLLAIEKIVDPNTGKPQAGATVTLEVTPDQAEVVTLGASMGKLSMSLRSVPAGEGGTDDDEYQISTASDLGISPAISDFIIFRTFNDPNLLRRRVQMSKLLNVNKKTSPSPQVIDSSTKSVTIYRAATPSTVIVKR